MGFGNIGGLNGAKRAIGGYGDIQSNSGNNLTQKIDTFGYKKGSLGYTKTIQINVGNIEKHRLTQANDPRQKDRDDICGHPAYWAPWGIPAGVKNPDGSYTISVEIIINSSYFEEMGMPGSKARKNYNTLKKPFVDKVENMVIDIARANPSVMKAEISSGKISIEGPEKPQIRAGSTDSGISSAPLCLGMGSLPFGVVNEDKEIYDSVIKSFAFGGDLDGNVELFQESSDEAQYANANKTDKMKYLQNKLLKYKLSAAIRLNNTAVVLRKGGKYDEAIDLFKSSKAIYKEWASGKKIENLSEKEIKFGLNLNFSLGLTYHKKNDFENAKIYYNEAKKLADEYNMKDSELEQNLKKAENKEPL